MDNKSWMKSSIDDLVFENRNQSYGAFSLRRVYDKHMTRGMLMGMLSFLLLICTPILYAKYQEFMAAQVEDLSMKEVTLAEPPPIDPKQPPPPPPPKVDPPPIKDQIKFVPPKVEKDEKVIDEEPPPTVEEIKDKVIATETKEGKEDGVDASLVEPEAPPPPPPPVIKEPEEDENKVFQVVQQKPEFPDGEKALLTYLAKNLKYPAIARENGIEGNVVVRFVVSKTGEIKNAEVLRTIGGGCDAEALRVVNSMPKWSPGKNNGKAVNVTYTLPVRFKLEG
jgi:periplasmic protein TonB